jgi:replication factor A2
MYGVGVGGGGGGNYDGGGGNASSLFGGGGFMPSQATNAAEGTSGGGGGFPKVLPLLILPKFLVCLFFLDISCAPLGLTPCGARGCGQSRNAQALLPLTVKQIMDASQTNDDKSNFAVNGMEVSTVRLVGRMLNKLDRVTDVSFTLDDGTGRVPVNRWENDSTDTKEMADIQ